MLGALSQLKQAFRSLMRNPGFAIAGILTLALGMGANTALFSVVNATFLKPLPYAHSERLMRVMEFRNGGSGSPTYPEFCDWKRQQKSFERLSMFRSEAHDWVSGDRVMRVQAGLVSADFFPMLGQSMAKGRPMTEADELEGAEPVVWLSHKLWQRALGGDPQVIGKSFQVDHQMHSIAGVLPEHFRFFQDSDLYLPLGHRVRQAMMTDRGLHQDAMVMGRLNPSQSLDGARAEFAAIAARLADAYPDTNRGVGVKISPLRDTLSEGSGSQIWILLAAVGGVLLIACVNVACSFPAPSPANERWPFERPWAPTVCTSFAPSWPNAFCSPCWGPWGACSSAFGDIPWSAS